MYSIQAFGVQGLVGDFVHGAEEAAVAELGRSISVSNAILPETPEY
jgi:hypothetical protein